MNCLKLFELVFSNSLLMQIGQIFQPYELLNQKEIG